MKEFKCSIYGEERAGVCFLEQDLPKKEFWINFLCEVMGGKTKQNIAIAITGTVAGL